MAMDGHRAAAGLDRLEHQEYRREGNSGHAWRFLPAGLHAQNFGDAEHITGIQKMNWHPLERLITRCVLGI